MLNEADHPMCNKTTGAETGSRDLSGQWQPLLVQHHILIHSTPPVPPTGSSLLKRYCSYIQNPYTQPSHSKHRSSAYTYRPGFRRIIRGYHRVCNVALCQLPASQEQDRQIPSAHFFGFFWWGGGGGWRRWLYSWGSGAGRTVGLIRDALIERFSEIRPFPVKSLVSRIEL
jgi:hypothetical protein